MRKFSLVVLFLLFCGTFAVAQKGEVGAGWDYLHVDCGSGCTEASVPGGFFVDGTYYFAKAIGLTGDFQYHKKTFSGGTDTGRFLSFHGGPRVKGRYGKVEPFAHVLFGVTNVNVSSSSFGSTSGNAFSMKFGGGLDVAVAPHFAIRLGEFNYYLTTFGVNSNVNLNGQGHQNNITFGVGVVIR